MPSDTPSLSIQFSFSIPPSLAFHPAHDIPLANSVQAQDKDKTRTTKGPTVGQAYYLVHNTFVSSFKSLTMDIFSIQII